MQVVDVNGNMFGDGALEITTSTGKPKIPVINTDITIGVTPIVSGTVGRVLFQGAGNVVQQADGLFYDAPNVRFGVGTSSPAYKLDVVGNASITTELYVGSLGINGIVYLNRASTGGNVGGIRAQASGSEICGGGFVDRILCSNGAGLFFYTYGGSGSVSTQRMQIFGTSGNVLIQNGGTFTDAGQKLQLVGNQATTIGGTGSGFTLTRTGNYDNISLTTLATITDTTSNANMSKVGLFVNISSASNNIAIQTVGAVGVGVTPLSNTFASGYFAYLYAGATINSVGNYNLNVRSRVSSYFAGNGGGISFWGDDRGQANANTAFAGIRGVKENSVYLNGLGALTFLTQASSAGLSTESTFVEVGRFTSGGNLLVNTIVNAGFRLDVNGTARVQGVITGSVGSGGLTLGSAAANTPAFTLSGYFTGLGAMNISNLNPRGYNVRISAQGEGGFYSSASSGNFQGFASEINYFKGSGSIDVINPVSSSAIHGYLFNPTITNQGLAFVAGFRSVLSSAANRWNLYIDGTASNYLASNLLINTTTDAGFKLDVNGTARISANSATGVLSVINTNTTSSISMASLLAAGATGDTYFSVGRSLTGGNSALIGHSTVGGGNYAFLTVYGRPANDFVVSNTGQVALGTSTPNSSARFVIESTTQGFLPPRMTTTQRNAIASPATGLVLYDTTLNKLCVYTTAWETVTSL